MSFSRSQRVCRLRHPTPQQPPLSSAASAPSPPGWPLDPSLAKRSVFRVAHGGARVATARPYRGTSIIRNNPHVGPTVALCPGTCGHPRGVGVSCERGTPVPRVPCLASARSATSMPPLSRTPRRNTTGPCAQDFCRVLGGGVFLQARYPCKWYL